MIKERPILFSAPMVRAILDNRKTQTRRIIKKVDPDSFPFCESFDEANGLPVIIFSDDIDDNVICRILVSCKYGKPGDRLWVRETWRYSNWAPFSRNVALVQIQYQSDDAKIEHMVGGFSYDYHIYYRPSIHMPRWASRILLEITNVRVERLQDISEDDAIAEGCEPYGVRTPDTPMAPSEFEGHSAIQDFSCLWESINGQGSWDLNPWVWVLEFKRIG
ncbi:hypothetical protein [Nitrosomonas ureae]|uniref:Morphogenetic protein n=1 Tax=Nitrosomonas ureae TaxID=44577 RepID=A0A1H2EQY7_9PROT|nr:hypothetical protein [Nitrosomonas ureae]ALQ51868.1 hypothetical protein ATY38_11965 [Nitrosomonas ureae]SDT97363.1 hypothetical protein SAMN05216406_11479 [Nitrosomonas ureae]